MFLSRLAALLLTLLSLGWPVQPPENPGSEIGNDVAVAMAVSPKGDLFVTGYSKVSDSGYDFETVKYDADGRLIWAQRYDGPTGGDDRPSAIGLDKNGNVYVTGSSEGKNSGADYLTLKYNSAGGLLWAKRYNGDASGADHPSAMVVSQSGKVWITGYSQTKANGFDCESVNYDSDGNQLWSQAYNGPTNGDDYGEAIRIDSFENCYVGGYSKRGAQNSTYLLVKYDSSGHRQWVTNYGGDRNQNARATALAISSNGLICETGYSVGRHGDSDILTVSYDSSGKQIWTNRFDGLAHGDDKPTGIEALPANGSIVIGASSGGEESGKDYVAFTLDNDGELKWQTRFNGTGNGDDIPVAETVANDGSVFLTGYSQGVDSGSDILTLSYDKVGKQTWNQRYNGAANDVDRPVGIGQDREGNVYVAGYSWAGHGGSFDYVALKYSGQGALVWMRRFDGMTQRKSG